MAVSMLTSYAEASHHYPKEPRVLVVDLELTPAQQVGFHLGLGLCGPNIPWPSMQKEKQGLQGEREGGGAYAVIYINPEMKLKTKVCRFDALQQGWTERFVFALREDVHCVEDLFVTVEVYNVQHGRGATMVGSVRQMAKNVLERARLTMVGRVAEDDDTDEIVECGPNVEWEGSTAARVVGRVEVRLRLQVWKEDFPRARQSGGTNWAMKYNELMCPKETTYEQESCN